jgi:Tfp pilus assembly protein PilN
MPDWNKEVKLSDLFGRSKKARADAPADQPAAGGGPAEEASTGEKKSLMKKEISFSLRRKDKGPKEPKRSRSDARAAKREAAKADKARRRNERGHSRREGRSAPPAPTVPVMRAFNLLPRDDFRDGRGRRPSNAQVALAVVALVALAALGAYFLMLNASVADKRAEADSLRAASAARTNPANQPADPDAEANEQLQQEQQARTAALASALGRRVAWDRLLRELSLVTPEDVSLTALSTAGGGAAASPDAAATATAAPAAVLAITGYTHDQTTVAQLLARLSVVPELETVKLVSAIRTDLQGDTVVQFSIAAEVKTSTGAAA